MRDKDYKDFIHYSMEQKKRLNEDVRKQADKVERLWGKMEREIASRSMEQAPMFNAENVFCPICMNYFPSSEYLKSVIDNDNTLWIANMITHYRHNHIKSWNRCWDSYKGNRYRSGWFGEYEEEKRLVNERAKRQIIRKCDKYLNFNKIVVSDFEKLEFNSPETLELARKKLVCESLP